MIQLDVVQTVAIHVNAARFPVIQETILVRVKMHPAHNSHASSCVSHPEDDLVITAALGTDCAILVVSHIG